MKKLKRIGIILIILVCAIGLITAYFLNQNWTYRYKAELRYSINSKGRLATTVGISGTGLSYVSINSSYLTEPIKLKLIKNEMLSPCTFIVNIYFNRI